MTKKKILIVEDDLILQNNIKEILEEKGYDVSTASDGVSGIASFYSYKPDLVLCDIAIPKKDGYQLLTEISDDLRDKSIAFIFLTAKVEKDDIRKGMLLGADDYIFKPFSIDDLLASIKLRLEKLETKESKKETVKHYNIDDKIIFKIGSKTELIEVRDIKFLRAESPYVYIKFSDGKSTLIRESLELWEKKLPEKNFVRIHRSVIVNTDYIRKLEKLGVSSYLIKLENEEEPFILSRRFFHKFKEKFS